MSQTHQEWLESRRYKVIRARRTQNGIEASAQISDEEIVASGLRWEAANALRNKLSEERRAANPKESSWTCDLFLCELETPQWNPQR